MPSRSRTTAIATTLDVAALALQEGSLALLLRRSSEGGWELPWAAHDSGALDAAAAGAARDAVGGSPSWLSLVGVFDDTEPHPAEAPLTIGFAALVPADATDRVPDDHDWLPLGDLPELEPRQRHIADAALSLVRDRLDHSPVAFRLLPEVFTLSELQQTYELLLGRALHKASFRRALAGAHLVQPTDEWRSEGRGRPAQLFRYAPRKRRSLTRSVRVDF